MKFKLAIPSLSRSELIKKHPLLKESIVCVRETQEDMYRKAIPDADIRVMPDSVKNLGGTRNWILDNVREPGDDFLFLLDDDITAVWYLMSRKSPIITDPKYMLEVIEHTGRLAQDAKAGVFGYSHVLKPQFRHGLTVVGLRSWVSGHAMGIVDTDLRFDEDMTTKGDFDMSLQSIVKSRLCWQDRRWHFAHEAWVTPGGQTMFRTKDVDLQDTEYLRQKWGRSIVNAGGSRKENTRGLRLSIGVE